MNKKLFVFLPFLFSLSLFIFICFNFNGSLSLGESIEKDRAFFTNSGALAAELDFLNEMILMSERKGEIGDLNGFFYEKLNKTISNIALIKSGCGEQISERINDFTEKILNHGKLAANDDVEDKSGLFAALKTDIITLKELVNLAARQKLGVLKYTYFVWQDFLNKTVLVLSALFLLATLVSTLIALKYGSKVSRLLALLGLTGNAGVKDAASALQRLSGESAAENEELNKKLAREQIVGRRKEDLLNAIPEGLVAAASGRVTFVNKTMKDWFGLESSAIGEEVTSVFSKVGTNGCQEKFINGGETYMLNVFLNQNETFYIFRNITKSEELSSRLINSERLASVGEMAARITHEIRNPLNTIKMNSDYLLENVDETKSEEKKQLLSLVVKEVERLEQITNKYMGMVNYQRSETAETGVQIPSDLVEFLSFHQPELQKRNIELSFEKDGEFVLSIIPDSFKEVMLNLLKNAWEELENGGKIAVRVRRKDNFAHISVEDSGRGIPQNERETVFKNFYTKKPGGTGIGLSHSRKLVTEAGGKLYIEDSALGGAAFVLEIPLKNKN